MTAQAIPILLEPVQLEQYVSNDDVIIVDLCKHKTYLQGHIPGARFLDYSQIVRAEKPVMGLLPEPKQFCQAMSAIGASVTSHIIAYDDEGGGKAARLLWTLACYGHYNYSLLNGGLHAWANEGHALSSEIEALAPSDYQLTSSNVSDATVQRDFILAHLDDNNVTLLDARSAQEFRGEKRYAERAGHIPGAVNIEWTEFMDQNRNLRLKTDEDLHHMLEAAGFNREQTVIVYCQTHHRSAHTWFVLKHLGYQVRGYEGSWSDWGNQSDTPITL